MIARALRYVRYGLVAGGIFASLALSVGLSRDASVNWGQTDTNHSVNWGQAEPRSSVNWG